MSPRMAVFRILAALLVLPLLGYALITGFWFHPRASTPVVGPAGAAHRAFIENRSFGDLSFVLCVSDWPHTFSRPLSLGCVVYSEGEDGRVFWSGDGSVILIRGGRDPASWNYTAAYDYRAHRRIPGESARIAALLASRGGLGPEQPRYPDGKSGDL